MKNKIIIILMIGQLLFSCTSSPTNENKTIPISPDKKKEVEPAESFIVSPDKKKKVKSAEHPIFINKARHDERNRSPYNPAHDGMKSENMFSDKFSAEISDVREHFSNYFKKFGKNGSLERHNKLLPSDWWIGNNFTSTSRVLFINLLNPKLQTYEILHGAQKELVKLKNDWMLLIGHDNDFDQFGEYVGKPGEYYFWINAKRIEVYAEREKDIQIFLDSLKNKN